MTDPDVTEKVERTDTGFRLTAESTSGTGTRDQDKVKAELRREWKPSPAEIDQLVCDVQDTMTDLRAHQPDEDGDADD